MKTVLTVLAAMLMLSGTTAHVPKEWPGEHDECATRKALHTKYN